MKRGSRKALFGGPTFARPADFGNIRRWSKHRGQYIAAIQRSLSRDRLSNGAMRQALEEELEDLLHHHQGLRDLKERRKREEIQSQMQDTRSLEAILENLIKQHRTLATCSWLGCARQTPSSPPRSAGRSKLSQVLDALPDPGSRRHPILELLTTSGHFWLMIAIHERSAPKPRPGRRRRCFSRRFQPNHQAATWAKAALPNASRRGLFKTVTALGLSMASLRPQSSPPKAGGPPGALPRCARPRPGSGRSPPPEWQVTEGRNRPIRT